MARHGHDFRLDFLEVIVRRAIAAAFLRKIYTLPDTDKPR